MKLTFDLKKDSLKAKFIPPDKPDLVYLIDTGADTPVWCKSSAEFLDIATSNATSLKEGRKAFLQLREAAKENGLQDMSLDEINDEIQAVRHPDGNEDC